MTYIYRSAAFAYDRLYATLERHKKMLIYVYYYPVRRFFCGLNNFDEHIQKALLKHSALSNPINNLMASTQAPEAWLR